MGTAAITDTAVAVTLTTDRVAKFEVSLSLAKDSESAIQAEPYKRSRQPSANPNLRPTQTLAEELRALIKALLPDLSFDSRIARGTQIVLNYYK